LGRCSLGQGVCDDDYGLMVGPVGMPVQITITTTTLDCVAVDGRRVEAAFEAARKKWQIILCSG